MAEQHTEHQGEHFDGGVKSKVTTCDCRMADTGLQCNHNHVHINACSICYKIASIGKVELGSREKSKR